MSASALQRQDRPALAGARRIRARAVAIVVAALVGFVLGLWLELGRVLERDAWAVRP